MFVYSWLCGTCAEFFNSYYHCLPFSPSSILNPRKCANSNNVLNVKEIQICKNYYNSSKKRRCYINGRKRCIQSEFFVCFFIVFYIVFFVIFSVQHGRHAFILEEFGKLVKFRWFKPGKRQLVVCARFE